MKKKPIVYLLLFSFMLTILLPVSTPAATQSFSDISTHWAKDYISQLASSGYIKGYTDGKFKPDNTMTKAEFTRVLIAALGSTAADETTNSFSDIKKHWAKASINEAVKLGILVTSEDPNGFRPDEGIMRSQAAAMLVRALGKDPDSTPVSFKDRLTVEKSDYKGYIKTASDLGLISGFPDGNFEPFTTMTRAQVCTVIVKFLNQLNGTSGNLAASSTTPVTGGINTIVVGEQSYNIGTTPIYFNIEFQDIRASSISSGTGSFKLNGLHTIDLNSESKNPDITVNNIRYGIKKFAVTGNNLIAYTDCRKINKIIIDQRTYKSDYVELYVNAATTDYFLSDLGIVDANTVKLKSDTYKLNKERISISLDNEQYFYDIEKISLGDTDTQPVLEECDPLVVKGLSRSDIAAIFSGYTTLDLYDLDDMAFIIDGEKYTFDKVELDASGNFIVDEENFPVDKVIITKDDLKYDINKIIMDNGKFIFYCDEGTEHNWVIIDD
ncbi:MAG: S-layer homology domain-containing protein, partial [Syntrophomonas sp.]